MIQAEIKQTNPQTVAFKSMHGSYSDTPKGYQQLYEWVEHYGLRPTGMPEAIYLTMPSVTPEGQAEWELWAPIAGGAGQTGPDEDGFGVKRIEPETVASVMYKGPYDGVGAVYQELWEWMGEQGYTEVGPPREVYYSGPEVPPEETVTEIQIPVART